jgi:hypothetical protein
VDEYSPGNTADQTPDSARFVPRILDAFFSCCGLALQYSERHTQAGFACKYALFYTLCTSCVDVPYYAHTVILNTHNVYFLFVRPMLYSHSQYRYLLCMCASYYTRTIYTSCMYLSYYSNTLLILLVCTPHIINTRTIQVCTTVCTPRKRGTPLVCTPRIILTRSIQVSTMACAPHIIHTQFVDNTNVLIIP